MQNKKSSYKEMLRDRISEMRAVDLALKWCKAKERWIDHVYTHFINIYQNKVDRYEATRIALGISSKYRNFDFEKTISWNDLDDYNRSYWETVRDWITWFQNNLAYIEQDIKFGITEFELSQKYSTDGLAHYLITNLS